MLGSPNAELAVTMSTEEKERVARQRERLGDFFASCIPANLKPWKPCRDETGAYEHHEVVQRSIKLPTLVGPILYPIWHLQNAPYKVAACLHLLR